MAEPQGPSPLGGLLNGIVQGYGLRQQLQQWKQQNQAAATKAAMDEQNASVQDIMNRMNLQTAGRPVANGTVTETRPDTNYDVPSQVPGAPPIQTGVPGGSFVRKADASRTVSYKDRQGNTTQTELYTPEEQQQRDAAAAQSKFRATAIPVKDENGQTIYMAPEHLAAYKQATAAWQPTPTTAAAQAAGAPASVPQRNVGQVITSTGSNVRAAGHDTSRENIAGENNQTREDIAAQNNSARTGISSAANALRKAIADNADKTRSDIAAKGQAGANARAAGAQAGANQRSANRLTAAQAAQQQKQLQALQGQEDDARAARVQLSADLASGTDSRTGTKLSDLTRKAKENQLAANASRLQNYQTRKAAAAGAQAPPKAKQDALKEGETAQAPDGHTWQKKDGIVFFVK